MKQVGFTVEEVDELIMRCKKSCDASIEHEIISVNIPSEVTNSIPNSYPSISPSIYALISTRVVEDGIVEVNPTNNMAIPMIVGVVLIGFLVLGFLIKRRPRTKTPEINASRINIKSQNIAHDSYFQNEEDYQDRSEGDLEFSRDDTLYSLLEVKLGLTNEVNIESVNRSSVSKPLSPVRFVMNNKKISDVTVDTEVSSFEKNTDDSYSSNYDERYSLDSKHTDSKDTSRENSSMKSSVIEMKETKSKSQTGVLDDNQNAKVVEKSQRDSTLSVMADSGNHFSVAAEEMCNTEDGSYLEIREPHPTSLMTIINDTMRYMNDIITKSQSDILPSNNSQSIVEDRDKFSSVTDFVFNLKKKCTKSFSTIHSGTTGVLLASTKADNDFKSSPTIASDSQLVILNAALNCLNSAGELTSNTDTIETVIDEDRRINTIGNHHRLLGKISEEKLNSSNLQRSSSTISCRGKGKGSSTILRSPSLNETVKNDPFSCIEMDNFSSLKDTCN